MKFHYEHTGSKIMVTRETLGDDRAGAEFWKHQEAKRLGQPVAISICTDGYHLITVASPKTLIDDDGD